MSQLRKGTEMVTATDRLRELLDERGVEWSSPSGLNSRFADGITFIGDVAVVSEIDGSDLLHINFDGTPEQAIAATLGSGTCVNMDGETDAEWFTCSECNTELRVHEPFDAFSIHYCPNCGRRVEVDDGTE